MDFITITNGSYGEINSAKSKHITDTKVELKPRVAIVYNLKRSENEDFVSQKTIDSVYGTIKNTLGYNCILIEAIDEALFDQLIKNHIDIVFNLAEGYHKRTRESQVPAICDYLNIEHTGSDATCIGVTLDKTLAKQIIRGSGLNILTPNYMVYDGQDLNLDLNLNLKFPIIVKLNCGDSSIGLDQMKSVVTNKAELNDRITLLWNKFHQPILCEEYIEGREFTIGILGNDVLGPREILFNPICGRYPVYDYQCKKADFDGYFQPINIECPVSLGKEHDDKVHQFARDIFKCLGCRDYARIDYRINSNGDLYFLELNALPGITPSWSDLVLICESYHIRYEQLIERMFTPAVKRWEVNKKIHLHEE
jgi:D-alanine-D-alanine ligase